MLPLLVLTSLVGCEGCQRQSSDFVAQFTRSFGSVVDVPTSDPTPPSVTLIIPDQGAGQIVLTETGSPFMIDMTHKPGGIIIVATADDPQGVTQVGFKGVSATSCKDSNGYSYTPSLIDASGPTETDPGTSGKAFTRRWVPRYVDDSALRCIEGYPERLSAVLTLWATGKNFAGVEVQSQPVKFIWKWQP
jgi:hypothetical protein